MDENQVVKCVCGYLNGRGYTVEQQLLTTQQGVDIVARHDSSGRRLYIEAKGGTSSVSGSARFGNPYTQSQVFDRVAKGVFTALELRSRYPDRAVAEVALAVPDSRHFRRYLGPVLQQLRDAGIEVLFVAEDESVVRA